MRDSPSGRPRPGQPRPYAFPPYSKARLDNGLEVIACHLPGRALGAARLVLEAGAENEIPEQAGVATLAARGLTEGTELKSAAAFTEAAERLGAEIEAEAGWDTFQVGLTVPASRLAPAMELLAEAALLPIFPPGEMERLREERLAEILQELADPPSRARHAFLHALYKPDSPYSRPGRGTLETVAGLERDDVEGYYRRFATPGTATFVLAGDLEGISPEMLAERLLGRWTAPEPERSFKILAEANSYPTVTLVDRPGSVQSHLVIGHVGLPRSTPDFFPVTAMAMILGGLFSSRLNLKLREEKGYTYGARAGFEFRRGAGPFAASTAVETHVTAPAALDAIEEIAKLHAAGAKEPELEEARDYLVGVFPIAFETPEAITRALAHLAVYGLPDDYYDIYRPSMRAVTLEQVGAAAREHLHPDRLALVAVGDANVLQTPMEDLGVAPITLLQDPPPGPLIHH